MIDILNIKGTIVEKASFDYFVDKYLTLVLKIVLYARAEGSLGYLIKFCLYQIMNKYVQCVFFFSRWAVEDPLKGMRNAFGNLFFFHAKSYCQTARCAWEIKLHIEENLSPYLAMACWAESSIALCLIKLQE